MGGNGIKKLLVANRGAIAARIFRTAHKLGIGTVAVFSDEDEQALHTRLADEAVRIGPAPSLDSYLRGDRIIQACKLVGADAIHPGYGFLSENASFAEAVHESGINFVGPPASAVRALGDKISSKATARDARVNLIPGHVGEVEDDDAALAAADEIGFPIMVKASAGGGGRGMRVAHSRADLLSAYRLAKEEAQSAFGDGRLLFERYFPRARHIEIQVLGDKHGNYFFAPERECSIQRRHQKLLEESPSPVITDAIRRDMGEQALRLAAAAGYYSAGTVEFLLDEDRNFYFLEMNTRLQVEHGVTEDVTGLDLVEMMLRIAAGEKLELEQDQLLASAHQRWSMQARPLAAEARVACSVCAENPAAGFLPSAGRLTSYREPRLNDVRIISGVDHGSAVPVHYDSLMTKIIAHSSTLGGKGRQSTIDRLADALDQYVARGVTHNAPFLRHILYQEAYRAGELSTAFIPEHFPTQDEALAEASLIALHTTAYVRQFREGTVPYKNDFILSGEHFAEPQHIEVNVSYSSSPGGPLELEPFSVRNVTNGSTERFHVSVDPSGIYGDDWNAHSRCVHVNERCADSERCWIQIVSQGPRHVAIQFKGALRRAFVDRGSSASLLPFQPLVDATEDSALEVKSPMSGLLAAIRVKPGDLVSVGDVLADLHAMKMVNEITAARDAQVDAILVAPGAAVNSGDKLIRLSPPDRGSPE